MYRSSSHRFSPVRFSRYRNVSLAVGALAFALLCSAWLGPDSNYDLFNYHFYNGWALVHGRLLVDVAPAGIQTYLNPLFDVPTAVSIGMSSSTHLFSVWSAVVQWWCWITVWCLAGELGHKRLRFSGQLFATVLAVSGSAGVSVAFTSFNDWLMASFVCQGLRLTLKARRLSIEGEEATWPAVMGGAWFAVALAVKLTAVPFVLAAMVAIVAVLPLHLICRWLVGAVASFAATSGPWMVYLFVRFDNPLFPFFNQVFGSSAAGSGNFDDGRFGARTLRDVVGFPVELARGSVRYGEYPFRDWRLVAALILGSLCVLSNVKSGSTVAERGIRKLPVEALLAGFALLSIVLWIMEFGIYRYFLPGEIVISILVVLLLDLLIPGGRAALLIPIPLVLLSAYQESPNWGRNVSLVAAAMPSLRSPPWIVLADGGPSSFLSRSFPAGARIAGTNSFADGSFSNTGPLRRQLQQFVAHGSNQHTLYVLLDPVKSDKAILGELKLHVDRNACKPLNARNAAFQLCPASLEVGQS